MNLKNFLVLCLSAALILGSTSCEKEDPPIVNEEEIITTLVVTMTPTGGGDDVVFRFEDLDGDGGNAATVTTDDLAASTDYTLSVSFLNESESPAEDITEEVQEEAEEHQVFYSNDLGITVNYSDSDANGDPIGLSCSVMTGAAGSGTFTVILRHEPVKDASGVSDGDITNAGGETDIEVSFPISVL